MQTGIAPPALDTVRRRIAKIEPQLAAKRREGQSAVRALNPAAGRPPSLSAPLERVQIDHTRVDLIVVDEVSREEIGRPWLTIGIDEFSRCIVGLVLTFEAPSATTVGLCLQHMACEKAPWIEGLGLRAEWPMAGIPKAIYVDNGSDFHSDAFRRGCEQHGIALSFRPPGQPHFGGVIERVIGTTMKQIHELPGTTFSNSADRGEYDSARHAALTLTDLTRWLVLAICGIYHTSVHAGIEEPPRKRWGRGVEEHGMPRLVPNPESFLIDFLPVLRRRVGRQGFVIDHIQYFDNSLGPFIARRHRLEPFVVRRDPRDLSRIWVLDPDSRNYLQIPYRTLSRPGITLWEHRMARQKLLRDGRREIDENKIFRTVDKNLSLHDEQKNNTRVKRRSKARRAHLKTGAQHPVQFTVTEEASPPPAEPFAEIEDW